MPQEGDSHCTGNVIYFYRSTSINAEGVKILQWIPEQSGNCPGTFPFPEQRQSVPSDPLPEPTSAPSGINQTGCVTTEELGWWEEAYAYENILDAGVEFENLTDRANIPSIKERILALPSLRSGTSGEKHPFVLWDSSGQTFYTDFTSIHLDVCEIPEILFTPAPEEDLPATEEDLFTPAPEADLVLTEEKSFLKKILDALIFLQLLPGSPSAEAVKQASDLLSEPESEIKEILLKVGLVSGGAFIGTAAVGGVALTQGITLSGAAKTGLGVGTTLAGIDVLALWAASDNVISGLSFTVRKIRDGVKAGVIDGSIALENFETLNKWLKRAVEFVRTSVKINPTLILFKSPFLINADKGVMDMRLEKILLDDAIKKFKEEEEKRFQEAKENI